LQSGQVWYWGGYTFRDNKKLLIDGYNLLQEDIGIPKDKPLTFGMGYLHDIVMVDDEKPTLKAFDL
jgi:hypothetical protein